MDASVVLPVNQYTSQTRDQVRALAGQETQHEWELILAGDEVSRQDAMLDLEDFPVPYKWVTVPKGCGEPHARNQGAKNAQGSVLLCCDSDDMVAENWLKNMLRAFEDESVDAVGGHIEEERLNEPDSHSLRWPFTPGRLPVVLGLHPRAVGANFGIRKQAWDAVGGFDEEFTWSCDTEFFMRLQVAGHKLVYCPDAVVHYRHGDLKESLRKIYHWNRTRPRLYKRFRAHGARRDPRWIRRWGWTLVASWRLFGGKRRRLVFYGHFLRRWGRLVGSIKYRTWFP